MILRMAARRNRDEASQGMVNASLRGRDSETALRAKSIQTGKDRPILTNKTRKGEHKCLA